MDRVILKGTLTSQIETRQDYYYGFFQVPNHEQEIPVIFKVKKRDCHFCEEVWEKQSKCGRSDCGYLQEPKWIKPNLKKGCEVLLTGTWANSQKDRPSFTCFDFKIIANPEPLTLTSLQKQLSSLLKPSLEQKKSWSETTDFLFRKKKELEEIEKISQLGSNYLQAYLLTKQLFYANYQTEHLTQANFSLETYLARISSELEITKRQMFAAGWKGAKHE